NLYFNGSANTLILTLSLHDALPIYPASHGRWSYKASTGVEGRAHRSASPQKDLREEPRKSLPSTLAAVPRRPTIESGPNKIPPRSEEHTSELQSRFDLVCRLLLEKK